MNEKRKMLLLKGAKNGGVVTIEDARNLYSSDDAARSAITSLEFQDYLCKTEVPGSFRIAKLPTSVKEKLS